MKTALLLSGHNLLTHYIDDILKLKENIVEIELNGESVR